MKISAAIVLLAFSLDSASAKAMPLYQPHRISYEELVMNKGYGTESFMEALSSVGLITVNGIPGYAHQRNDALLRLHGCSLESKAALSHKFEDGTVRRTMATHTIPGPGGAQSILHDSDACASFDAASKTLRSTVADVTAAFGKSLGDFISIEKPLLETEDGMYAFGGFADVVENGEHLEHFHSYQRPADSAQDEKTIEFHTDQGLFIAFTPGLMVDSQDNMIETQSSSGFHIELKDGTHALVDFQDDDLVFMLGDGVNQIINPKIQDEGKKLRATPHALSIPNHKEDEARAWYGRMVLPPTDAVHPEHGDTFGNIRNLMIDAAGKGEQTEKLGLGCSSSQTARNLEEISCQANSIYCWSRCMSILEEGIPHENYCQEERNLRLDCVNPRNQTYTGGHGDYYPACTASTENATSYPKLPVYQEIRDPNICTDTAFNDFAKTEGYAHSFDLGPSIFMWSVVDGEVDGRLVFDGVFGFLAIGHASFAGGPHDAMNGASIIMALPGGDYSAVTGLDLSLEPNINEYVISHTASAFRHWKEPVSGANTSSYEIEVVENCFTAIKFKTSEINGIPFDLNGKNDLIWSGNNQDYYAGYHGYGNRGIFVVDFSSGEAYMKSDEGQHQDGNNQGGEDVASKTSDASSMFSSWSTTSLLAIICISLYM
mmetsp:Transcript_48457/g.73207  ORF Transcript_48457/g.73207 Transcript_48457/m.73207 type:complete len:659 (-) Transcript_48457:105-2081(-)